jgi:hypothetical protein
MNGLQVMATAICGMVVVISKWPKWLEHILQKEYLILPYEDQ